MNRERWQQIEKLLSEVLETPEEQQEDHLRRGCGDDPELRREVEELLRAYRKTSNFIERPPFEMFPEHWQDSFLGAQFGPYRLVEQIGEGGMGAVYRAERNDGQFAQQVAVKLVRPGLGAGELLRHLRSERQILATLNHPNIARLLDGGVSSDGQPYVVMEHIQGTRITEYARKHALTLAGRLALFQKICSAVIYAHQHLIVHRDIKPGNILVGEDGAPKLLDFGIAKILGAAQSGAGEQTLTQSSPFTPDYASPEQLRGESITTATDIYSLGVLLYELLAFQKPYRLKDKTPLQAAEIVCRTDPPRPSTMAGNQGERISRDLDAIVLKAMRKEPQHRYASASQLSEDIENFLAGQPVSAQQGSWTYLAGKFVRRHRYGVAATAAVALLLAVGIPMVLWQAHVARVERARAERHFNDVRKLANSFMFEFHDSIADLPGAIPARKLVVTRALEYLDSLAQEAGNDSSLQRELATAYERVGDVQGNPYLASLGDTAGAIASYRKCLSIREALLQANPGNKDLKLEVSGIDWKLGQILRDIGDFPGALADLREALRLTQQQAAGDSGTQDRLAGDYASIATVLKDTGDLQGALENYRNAIAVREAIKITGQEQNLTGREHLPGDYVGLAETLQSLGQHREALETQRKAVAMLEELAHAAPGNATLQRYLAESYGFLGDILYDDQPDASLASYHQAQSIYKSLVAADHADMLSLRLLGYINTRIGYALIQKHREAAAFESLRKAQAILEEVARKAPETSYLQVNMADVYLAMGRAHAALAATSTAAARRSHVQEACAWLQKGVDTKLNLLRQGRRLTGADTDDLNQAQREMASCPATVAAK